MDNMEGYPARVQANGMVPSRPQSHLRGNNNNNNNNDQLVMGDQQQPPPPAYSIGNGSAGGGGGGAYASNSNPPSRGHRESREQSQSHGQPSRESSRPKTRDPSSDAVSSAPKILKIAVVGDSAVGKTLICQAATSETFTFKKNYHLTCGVSVYPKSVKLPDRTEGEEERVNMALLDSSGKDIYVDYLPKYWDKLQGVAVVIDLTSKVSLQNATEWFRLAESCFSRKTDLSGAGDAHSISSSSSVGVLIGNKMDLTERRAISPKSAQEFATKHNLQYFECSVKENSGIEEPFFYLAHQWATGSFGSSVSSNSNKENIR